MFSQAALNATLNGTSAILLAAGYTAIRSGKRELHKKLMLSAFFVSCAFLVSYLIYHYRVGHVAFQGHGWIRPVYFAILISHTILAIVIVPLIIMTLRRALLEKFDKHKLIARYTLPLWFYVSVTGVIVYFMVYQIYAPGVSYTTISEAREITLKGELSTLRQAIDNYTLDRQRPPQSIQVLVDERYLREIPTDPFSMRKDWVVHFAQTDSSAKGIVTGIDDVHSASAQVGRNGTPYNTW